MDVLVHRLSPHSHSDPRLRVVRFERYLAEDLVEVLVDDRRLDDDEAVVHQRRHHGFRVELEIVWCELIAFKDIEIVPLPSEALLPKGEAHLRGTDRRAVMIKLDHEMPLLPSFNAGTFAEPTML